MAGGAETGTGRGMRIVLVVSLALNLLVIGAIGGAMLLGGGWHHRGPARMEAMGGPLTRALAPEDRRALAREMYAAHLGRDRSRDRLHDDFAGLVADLRATPFDPQAVAARLERIQSRFRERIGLSQALLVARLEEMDDAARAAYADRLEAELRGHHRGGSGVRRPDDSKR